MTLLAIVLIIIFLVIPAIVLLVFLGLLGAACSAISFGFVPVAWMALVARRRAHIGARTELGT